MWVRAYCLSIVTAMALFQNDWGESMDTTNATEKEQLLEKINGVLALLATPERLSPDDVLDHVSVLTDLTRRAALAFERTGDRQGVVDLYDRLVRELRQASEQMTEAQRYPIEALADFWALTVEARRSALAAASPQAPASAPPPRASTKASQISLKEAQAYRQQPGIRSVEAVQNSSLRSTSPMRPGKDLFACLELKSKKLSWGANLLESMRMRKSLRSK